jgi:putative endonuclease
MSCWVYIIQSQSTGRHYCGISDNADRRITQHNDPQYQLTRTTKIWKGLWQVIWTQGCANKREAMVRERKIKKRGIGRYLQAQLAESRQRRESGPCRAKKLSGRFR